MRSLLATGAVYTVLIGSIVGCWTLGSKGASALADWAGI